MPIAFEEVPGDPLVPFTYFELAPAPSPFNASLKCVFIGCKNQQQTAVAEDNTPYILSQTEVERLFGRGSMVEAMYRKAKRNAPLAEFWGVSTAQDAGAVRSFGNIRIKSLPSQNGMASVTIAGYNVAVPVTTTDTEEDIATRLATQVNKSKHLPVVADQDGTDATIVNITAKWRGGSGNDILMSVNKWSVDNKIGLEVLTVNQLSGGTGSNNIAAALTSLGDQPFDVIAVGFEGSTGAASTLNEFFNHTDGRWAPHRQLFGHGVISSRGTFAELITLGEAINYPHVSVMGYTGSLTPPWEWTASLSARMTQHLATPPEMSRPLQTLELTDVQPSILMDDWYTTTENKSLIDAGISTFTVDPDRTVRISRIVTTRKTNVWGDPDPSWRDVETLFQQVFFTRSLRAAVTGAFPRAALSDHDLNIPGFASPGKVKDLIIHEYRRLERLGLVENSDLFSQVLVVERNLLDANRIDALIPIDVVNQFRIFAARVESNLQLTDSVVLQQ
ncbi:MAG: phage tail sheath subtilisin-like domain-containing protein [Anaerolineae bacterium]|nr:phage tail sheath subtilisin-like domain-containing protein [Anaerolineae bacterium]